MTFKWRLVIVFIQLIGLFIGTKIVTGFWLANEVWFFSGLLAVIINPQLLEPYYPRPVDVLANSIVALLLFYFAPRTSAAIGWNTFAILSVISFFLALTAILAGSKESQTRVVQLARVCTILCRKITSLLIYSIVFWLALIDYSPTLGFDFWVLGIDWAVLVIIGAINWQTIWSTMSGKPLPCKIEGMIGPSVLLVSSPQLPQPGTQLTLAHSDLSVDGLLLTRIYRANDSWGQIHVQDPVIATQLLQSGQMFITPQSAQQSKLVGSVQQESTVSMLRFLAPKDHRIGDVVTVPSPIGEVLYQISTAKIVSTSTKGGAHLVVETNAAQLGVFDMSTLRIIRYRWVPPPGAPVVGGIIGDTNIASPLDPNYFKLGSLIGTPIPIFLDLASLTQGHLAILGMTRMGKSTLAARLTAALSRLYRVTLLDQTGEYISKRGYTPYDPNHDSDKTGSSVLEVPKGKIAANIAVRYLERIMGMAESEYRSGTPNQRIVIIDEAHQFIPEPAGLGFNAPGRDDAYKFGILMMQVRKYGISIILISQRTAVVAKSALSQCENLIAFKSVDQTGLDYLEQILGESARPMLPLLNQGEALACGPAISTESTVAIVVDPT